VPLTAGTRLGPYEISAALGAGGMGEVYRARDARLGRDVAIKVLPDGVATEPERLQRFEREDQADPGRRFVGDHRFAEVNLPEAPARPIDRLRSLPRE
jgi:serine/threonine protein kinase